MKIRFKISFEILNRKFDFKIKIWYNKIKKKVGILCDQN